MKKIIIALAVAAGAMKLSMKKFLNLIGSVIIGLSLVACGGTSTSSSSSSTSPSSSSSSVNDASIKVYTRDTTSGTRDGFFTTIKFEEAVKDNTKLVSGYVELASKKVPVLITTGAMSDPYCKLEETLGVTRKMLELFIKYRCGVMFLTKSTLALRDLDLYKRINEQAKVLASFTITCFDDTLREKIEPYSSSTKDRFMALKKFYEAGIETCIWLCPILPFITDTIENISNIVDKCYEVGVTNIILWDFGTTMREGSRDYFYKNLDKYFPGYKKMYQDTYKNSYVCPSLKNDELMKVFKDKCHKYGIKYDINQIYKIQEQEMQKNLEKTDFNLFNMDK